MNQSHSIPQVTTFTLSFRHQMLPLSIPPRPYLPYLHRIYVPVDLLFPIRTQEASFPLPIILLIIRHLLRLLYMLYLPLYIIHSSKFRHRTLYNSKPIVCEFPVILAHRTRRPLI